MKAEVPRSSVATATSPQLPGRKSGASGMRGMGRAQAGSQTSRADSTHRALLAGLRSLRRGDFSVRLPNDLPGFDGQLCESFNELAHFAASLCAEMIDLRRRVGLDGRTQLRLGRVAAQGGWADCVSGINDLLDDITANSADVAKVLTAVARGDLSQVVDLERKDVSLRGDFLRQARLVNGIVAQLAAFSSEITRVAQEIGVDGKLDVQARTRGVSGVWKEVTESVNLMAINLTKQVREIAQVTTSVARGDLSQTVHIEAKGEILQLKKTINTMVDQLSSLASEVTRVAREVGSEGLLGGQARVRGVSGVWRELTRSVNSMANNLTKQVRNIAEVATAIAAGDLSR